MGTEQRNPETYDLDKLQTPELVMAMNRADQSVALAVASAMDQIAAASDAVAPKVRAGGRIFYVGAGTSGRLAVAEAVECHTTFGVPEETVQGVLAGGYEACHSAVTAADDDPEQAAGDLDARRVSKADVVVGVTASGATPYTLGALRHARSLGALTVGISCNRNSELSREVDYPIEVDTGPEVVAGSTRMKAGTAQKMILNIITTTVMVRLGHVYSNLMVNLTPTNTRLFERGVKIITQITGAPETKARAALEKARDVKTAVVMLKLGCSLRDAQRRLRSAKNLREMIG
jgi:N-acetylmuramic acid 6-phosphate etherase